MDIRKIIVENCYQCKWMVFKSRRGDFCHHPDTSITKISDSNKIPDFCPLEKDA